VNRGECTTHALLYSYDVDSQCPTCKQEAAELNYKRKEAQKLLDKMYDNSKFWDNEWNSVLFLLEDWIEEHT